MSPHTDDANGLSDGFKDRLQVSHGLQQSEAMTLTVLGCGKYVLYRSHHILSDQHETNLSQVLWV